MTSQQQNSQISLVPMESVQRSVAQTQSAKKKKNKQEKLTRIEKYNVAELCWKYYLNLSREPDDIVHLLNKHLEAKRDVLLREHKVDPNFHFPKLTRMDVRIYLEKQHEQIEKYLGQQRKRMMEDSFDVIKKIQDLVIGCEETLGLWRSRLEDAVNKNDEKGLIRATVMLQKERQQLQGMVKDLAQLLGKVKTYISIDMMQQQVMSIADIIERDDMITEDVKIHLLQQVMQTMEITAVTKAV